ncbi:MAG: SDR family NAD(P)-dependent oxidoreductase [Traorella sp.]
MRLKNKVFIITGAASGMGQATCAKFEAEGAKIVACDCNEKVMSAWDGHENVTPLVVDVTNLEDVKKMVQTAKDVYGKLDGVCNIAGINDHSYPLLECDDERWDKVLGIDLKAPFRIMREAMPLLIENGGGSIVNIGSYAALRGNHGPSYTAAKTGLEGLTKSVAFAYAKNNVRCNIIHPGGCATGLTMGEWAAHYHEAQNALSALCKAMPVNGFGTPDQIANACCFLCSDEAKWVNGAVLSVDGGMSVC